MANFLEDTTIKHITSHFSGMIANSSWEMGIRSHIYDKISKGIMLYNKLHYFLLNVYNVFLFCLLYLGFLRQGFIWSRLCIKALVAKHGVLSDYSCPCLALIGQLTPWRDCLLRQAVSQDSISYLSKQFQQEETTGWHLVPCSSIKFFIPKLLYKFQISPF